MVDGAAGLPGFPGRSARAPRPAEEDKRMRSMADAWAARAGDDTPGLRYEDSVWSWSTVVAEAARRAAWWSAVRAEGPPHVGVLLDKIPDHVFWLGACALSGAVYVGANP